MEEKNIVAIEIGSSKVRGAIGSCNDQGVLTVHAVEEEPMLDWVRYGAVSNVEEVANLVGRIVRKIENRISPRKVQRVYVGVGGRSFGSTSRTVEQQFADDVEITSDVLTRLMNDAKKSYASDRCLLAVVPREYMVDKTVVSQPKGTVGRSIRMTANQITCRPQIKRNVDRLFVDKLKLSIADYKVRQLALADVILTTNEKRLGCMLVDFGAETTAVSIYKNGELLYMATLPLGSRNITRDIMRGGYLEEKAEELKRNGGNVIPQMMSNLNDIIEGTDYTEMNKHVSHRSGEIIANIRKQLDFAGVKADDLAGGIVITGGGSRLTGFNETLSKRLGMRLRVGSVNLTEIRIPDSRVSPVDAADVISILYRAMVDGAEECLVAVEPQVEVSVAESVEEKQPESPIQPIGGEEVVPTKKKPSHSFNILKILGDRVVDLMTERDVDDDYRDDV